MVQPSRRALLCGAAAALLLAPGPLMAAAEPIVLNWGNLIPEGANGELYEELRKRGGIVSHGDLSSGFIQDLQAKVTTAYNGKRVRLPGFVVPLDFDSTRIKAFLLVPFIGACIHVPPPPPNQIVYVQSETSIEVPGYYDAVWVTGTLNTHAKRTGLAEIGYSMAAERVEPYE